MRNAGSPREEVLHSFSQSSKALRGFVDLRAAQLDLDRRPASVVERDDGVGLKARPVAVVKNSSSQLAGINAQIANAEGLEK